MPQRITGTKGDVWGGAYVSHSHWHGIYTYIRLDWYIRKITILFVCLLLKELAAGFVGCFVHLFQNLVNLIHRRTIGNALGPSTSQ
jgi:hypothetical protein